ncbi:hypothetical protein CL614_04240 [archaeon]|nr:hypothetical protein [archaeon]|tara:strand:- start:1776 stop:2276 length:501 start_codon:yes stop_codon:yes gene_type:complete
MGYFSDVYDNWEEIQLHKYKEMMGFVKQMDLSSKHVLDVGCGNGFFEKFLVEKGIDISNFVGIDPDKKMLAGCIIKNKIMGRAKNMNFKNIFDSVICIDTLHLLEDASKLKQALKKDGFLLLGLFANNENEEERMKLVKDTFSDLTLLGEKVIPGKEKELVFLFQK